MKRIIYFQEHSLCDRTTSNDFLFQEVRDDETDVFTYKHISATTNQAKYLGVSSNCIDRNLYVNCTKKTERRCLFKKKR